MVGLIYKWLDLWVERQTDVWMNAKMDGCNKWMSDTLRDVASNIWRIHFYREEGKEKPSIHNEPVASRRVTGFQLTMITSIKRS